MADRRYTKTHEWITVEGKNVTIGITDFAQSELGDVVFLELPGTGRKIQARESFGVIESVKAASDLYSPYGEGWILKLELTGDLPPDLIDEAEYKKVTEASSH